MMRVALWRVSVMVIVLSISATGRGQEALTLPEALALAQAQNPELLAARQDLAIARSRLMKAHYISQFNPTLGGEVTHRSSDKSPDSVDFAVTLSQEIEIAGQRGKRIEEAERNLTLVSQRVRDRERLLLAQVKEGFYGALSLRRRFDLSRQVEDLNRRVSNSTVDADGLYRDGGCRHLRQSDELGCYRLRLDRR